MDFIQLADQVLEGTPLTDEQAMAILQANGAELTVAFAGAHKIRETHFGTQIHLCSIINAKSGRCPENCAFCSQSSHHNAETPIYPLKSKIEMVEGARKAEQQGSQCYGIVTSGTGIAPGEELNSILEAIQTIRQTTAINPSASLGILDKETARQLAEAGCATYHHNLETARSFFPSICSTHDYEEDVQTVKVAKASGMKVCCGGIFGLGESLEQRVEFARTLKELDVDSTPLNFLNPIKGTPLEGVGHLTPMDCLRIIAMFRYMMPNKKISVCGGRETNLKDYQSWIFMAGASGTMVGNYLTTSGRNLELDMQMFKDGEMEVHVC